MRLRQMFRVTNRKVRWTVGLFLAALLCVQCTQRSEATRDSQFATVISGQTIGKNSPAIAAQLEKLAQTDHVALLEMCLQHYRNSYRDYTCTFVKQERLSGKLGKEQAIQVKFMGNPFSVAMYWVKNKPIADRLLYVQGKWNNQMLVQPAGVLAFVGTQMREPAGPEAMQNTLRPVNLFGFERGMVSLIDVYKQAQLNGDVKEEFGKYADVGGRKAIVLVRYLPPKHDYPAQKTLIYIDLDYLVPIMIEGYDWDNKLSCRYLYTDIKFNVNLTSDDFLPEANGMTKPAV